MSALFERATREQFRFPSNKGELTTEQLWQLPLQSKTNFDLDTVAKTINAELKKSAEESFVTPSSNTGASLLSAKLDVVKAVIAYRQDENARRRLAADKAAQRERLLNALNNAEQQQLLQMSPDELRKQLAELDS